MHLPLRALAHAVLVVALATSSAAATDVFTATEHQITTAGAFDTLPSVARDAVGTYVVYSVRAVLSTGYGPGLITYQRLDGSGAPVGPPVPVSLDGTDSQLNDASGKYIVYTAYDSQATIAGRIVLYDVETGTSTVLRTASALREVRIHGSRVVWMEGAALSGIVMLLDLDDASMTPKALAGPSPSATDPEIGDRFVVWDEFANNQRDVHAYDLQTGERLVVANDAVNDEWLAATSGPWVVWETRIPGTSATRIEAKNLVTGEHRVIADNGAASYAPTIEGNLVTYESRVSGNFDVYVYRLDTQETFRVTSSWTDQRLNYLFGELVAYVDSRSGNLDVYVSTFAWTLQDPCAALGGDADGDGVCDATDSCKSTANPDQADLNGNGVGDACEPPPVADAGADQVIVQLGAPVLLDGSASYDLEGDPLAFEWTTVSAPAAVSLANATTATPSFTPPAYGEYTFQLRVSDGASFSGPDLVTFSFSNVAPVASAGGNQLVTAGDAVALLGAGTDANGDALTYAWELAQAPAGSAASIQDAGASTARLVTDVAGDYVARLVVSDGLLASAPSLATVTAAPRPDDVQTELTVAIDAVNGLAAAQLRNANLQNALTSKLADVSRLVAAGAFAEALDKLRNDVLPKTNGCATSGAPDRNDWITDCGAQARVSAAVSQVIELVRGR